MEQKKFEQTQLPKPKRKRYRPLIRRKHLRATGTTAVKKEQGKVKLNEYVLKLEAKVKAKDAEIARLKKDMNDAGLMTKEEFEKWLTKS